MKIEAARRLDALPTLALYREVLAESRYFVAREDELQMTLEQREHEIERLNQSDNSCFLVARIPECRVAGLVLINGGGLTRTRHVGRLEIMVASAYRSRKIGAALLDAAIARARSGAVLRKISLAVLADNVRAIALYRSRGFVEEGHRVAEYRESDGTMRDDLLFALHLDERRP